LALQLKLSTGRFAFEVKHKPLLSGMVTGTSPASPQLSMNHEHVLPTEVTTSDILDRLSMSPLCLWNSVALQASPWLAQPSSQLCPRPAKAQRAVVSAGEVVVDIFVVVDTLVVVGGVVVVVVVITGAGVGSGFGEEVGTTGSVVPATSGSEHQQRRLLSEAGDTPQSRLAEVRWLSETKHNPEARMLGTSPAAPQLLLYWLH